MQFLIGQSLPHRIADVRVIPHIALFACIAARFLHAVVRRFVCAMWFSYRFCLNLIQSRVGPMFVRCCALFNSIHADPIVKLGNYALPASQHRLLADSASSRTAMRTASQADF